MGVLTEQAEHELTEAVEALRAFGSDVTESDVVIQIGQTLREILHSTAESGDGGDLTEEEKALLRQGGFNLSPRPPGASNPFVRTAAKIVTLLETAYTAKEAAALLGINESRIRQRCGMHERTLYGVKWRNGWRLPRFQFDEGHLVPFVERVIPTLPPDLDLIAVHNWFTYPNDDLRDECDREMSPRDWLIAGRDYAPVAKLATGLEYP